MNIDDYTFEEIASIADKCVLSLLAEVERLSENIEVLRKTHYSTNIDLIQEMRKMSKGYIAIWDYLDPKGHAWQEEKFVTLLKEHGFDTGDEEE